MSDTLNPLRGSSLLDRIANPTVVNPLAAYSDALRAAQGVWTNRQAQANQAVGQAYQGAIDENGNFDPVKFRQNLVAAGPGAALAAQSGVESAQKLQGAQIEQGTKMQAALSAAIAPVLKLPDDQLHDGVAAAAQKLIATGAVPADVALRFLSRMPNAPGAMRTTLEQLRVGAMSPEQQQTNIYGTPTPYTAPGGAQQNYVTAPPSAGYGVSVPPQPGAQTGMTAAEMAQPVHWTDTNGVEHNTTAAEYATARGLGHVVTPPTVNGQPWQPSGGWTAPQAAPGGAPQPKPGPANPPRLNPQPAAPSGGAPQPPAAPKLTDTTGPVPGTVESAQASAKQYADDNTAAGSYTDRVFPLAQAQSLLKDTTTGPGTEAINRLKSFLLARASTFGWNPTEIGGVGKYEELNKYLTQYVNKMGAGSDARLASALSGNPNAHISTLANRDVVSAMIGLERMHQAAITDFNNQHLPPSQYSSYLRDWQTSHDPRAFIVDLMAPDKQTKMLAGMTPSERKAFGKSLDFVADNGQIMNLPAVPH